MYDNSVSLQKRLVGRLTSSIMKIFSFSLSQLSLIMLSFVFNPLLLYFLSFYLSLGTSRATNEKKRAGVGDVMSGGARFMLTHRQYK